MSSRENVPVRTCPRCEKEVQDPNVTFCPHCGVNLHVPRTVFQSAKKPTAQPSRRRINLLFVFIGLAVATYFGMWLSQCAHRQPVSRFPENGDIVRVICKDPEKEWGVWVANGKFLLVDYVVDDEWDVKDWLPCGTVVTIRNVREERWGDIEGYYIVPLDKELPSGWLIALVVEDLEFEMYAE